LHEKKNEYAKDVSKLDIYVGANDLGNNSEFGREFPTAKEIIIHAGWDPKSENYEHDIALIRLSSPLKFNVFIKPICIMTTPELLDYGRVAGWGEKEDGKTLSEVAKIAKLKTSNVTSCLKRKPELVRIFWEESFCAENIDQGVCKGDSGSGFYFDIRDKIYLKGIVSSTFIQSCSKNTVALYSDISKYFEFIEVRNHYFKVKEFNIIKL
jgi:secreted trypsin-like serine protease